MQPLDHSLDSFGIFWRLAATLFFVLLNGFFVAAEFALVKVRRARIDALAAEGKTSATVTRHLLEHLDLYLSACQLGITVASLALGWLGEPAVARLIVAGLASIGVAVTEYAGPIRFISFALAFLTITTLHMVIGEQAPKMWALERAESTALGVARGLRAFTSVCRPFIATINQAANSLLRVAGLSMEELRDATHTSDEISAILSASAKAGHISERQREIAENILGIVDLEVRHIMVPRADVVYLSLRNTPEENLATLRSSGHSRFPLCTDDLDDVVGVVHAKDVLALFVDHEEPELRHVVRTAPFVPDTMPLPRLIAELQVNRSPCAVVVDEYGTTIGLAFLENALEEIVGPIQNELDDDRTDIREVARGVLVVNGGMSLPEAADRLGLTIDEASADTIGGHIVAELGRLPKIGDKLTLGSYRVIVLNVDNRRVTRLRFERKTPPETTAAPA
jgi:CBS domain containing-hemolysin-like protein